jgi:hypothetical protein
MTFEYYGQTVPPAATQTAAKSAAYVPPVAAKAQRSGRVESTAIKLGMVALAYAFVMGTLGAWMVADGSPFVTAWSQVFGWRGPIGAPLVFAPLVVVLLTCALVTWALLAMGARVAGWVRNGG